MADTERHKGGYLEHPQFDTYEQVHAYVSRLVLEGHGRLLLGEDTQFEFLESQTTPATGVVIAHLPLKGREEPVSFVFGVVDQRGDPNIALQSLPTGQREFYLAKEIAKKSGIPLKW